MAELSEKSFPFDSEEVNGVEDRLYLADEFAEYFRSFISSGIFMKSPDNLQVVANNDMTVTLKPGKMIIDGYGYTNTDDIIINLDPADGVLNRIDRISATWSLDDRDIHYTLQKGEYSYEPIAPECRRNAEYKDYVVADIHIDAGVVSITQENIVDQRLNSEVCGLAIPFAEIDTAELNAQLQAFYERVMQENEQWIQEEQEEILAWFETLQNQLSGDVAANLLNMINEIKADIGNLEELDTDAKTSIVGAINELKEEVGDTLQTLEEAEATTDPAKPVGAGVIKELNESLGGISQWIVDESTGKITGYKTEIGGADTVFPFSSGVNLAITFNAYVAVRTINTGYIAKSNVSCTFYIINNQPDGTFRVTTSPNKIATALDGYNFVYIDHEFTITKIATIDENKNELEVLYSA